MESWTRAPSPTPTRNAHQRPRDRTPSDQEVNNNMGVDHLWQLLSKAKNDLGKLVEILDGLDNAQLRSAVNAYGEALDELDIEDCRVDLGLSDNAMDDMGDWIIAMGRESWQIACRGGDETIQLGKEFLDFYDGKTPSPWHLPSGLRVGTRSVEGRRVLPAEVFFAECFERLGESFHEVKWETVSD